MKKTILGLLLAITMLGAVGCGTENGGSSSSNEPQQESMVKVHILNVSKLKNYNTSAACTIIEDGNKITVIDAGSIEGKKVVTDYLTALNVTKIDNLILTHAHSDHAGGMMSVIERFDIGNLYLKPINWDNLSAGEKADGTDRFYNQIFDLASQKINEDESTVKIIEPKEEGVKVKTNGDNYFQIFNCTTIYENQFKNQDYNAFSFGIKYVSAFGSFYFAGDSTDAINPTLKGQLGECLVYKLNHHGTDGPYTSKALMDEMKPKYCVVSGVRENFGSNSQELCKQSGAEVLVTGDVGTIIFTAKKDNVSVKTLGINLD